MRVFMDNFMHYIMATLLLYNYAGGRYICNYIITNLTSLGWRKSGGRPLATESLPSRFRPWLAEVWLPVSLLLFSDMQTQTR